MPNHSTQTRLCQNQGSAITTASPLPMTAHLTRLTMAEIERARLETAAGGIADSAGGGKEVMSRFSSDSSPARKPLQIAAKKTASESP